jgi:hypothetical protein
MGGETLSVPSQRLPINFSHLEINRPIIGTSGKLPTPRPSVTGVVGMNGRERAGTAVLLRRKRCEIVFSVRARNQYFIDAHAASGPPHRDCGGGGARSKLNGAAFKKKTNAFLVVFLYL